MYSFQISNHMDFLFSPETDNRKTEMDRNGEVLIVDRLETRKEVEAVDTVQLGKEVVGNKRTRIETGDSRRTVRNKLVTLRQSIEYNMIVGHKDI